MKLRWQDFEDQVRDIATHVYGRLCKPGRLVGSDIDGIVDISKTDVVLIEITTDFTLGKVRSDINKLVNVRNGLFLDKKFARCVIVVQRAPTTAMREGAEANNVDIFEVSEFAAQFLEYERYRIARLEYPFGSAINPESGEIDTIKYVPVVYEDRKTGRSYTHEQIGDRILAGHNFVIVGEYGSGKSRCVEQVFKYISQEWGATFRFPVAVNLRECWGLEDADEIVRRHFTKLGLEEMRAAGVKAYNRKAIVFLLDGFDEIGIQSWSSDAQKIREVRAQALSGVQDAVKNSGTGSLITGREHYFANDAEMLSSLSLRADKVTILRVKQEFTVDELLEYFKATGIDVTLPDWLPRRPLICQTIARLPESERDAMFVWQDNAVDFWRHFMKVICERDARINKSFNAETIFDVFVELSHLTRNKAGDVGPISTRELQETFERIRGALPVENAAVMLQRLPSLGRIDQDSADRQFIDTYILDGLRATGIIRMVDADEDMKAKYAAQQWSNPLRALGQQIVAREFTNRPNGYINLAKKAASHNNRTLASDIVAASARAKEPVDFSGMIVTDAAISELDLENSFLSNLAIDESTIEELILPKVPPKQVEIRGCAITKISGVSSASGLPSWFVDNDVEEFDSVRTMSRIREVGLNPAHEVLVVILKKTFFQPGTGRKEEALLRGFESGKHNKVVRRVISALVGENFLGSFKGDQGTVYTPNRAMTARAKRMLDELKASQDELWVKVEGL